MVANLDIFFGFIKFLGSFCLLLHRKMYNSKRKQHMSTGFFRFKQFTVWHDRCAMKVGTDGVLLGAKANVEGARRILDVGTGSGVIALQLAQRAPEAHIVAVEIDPEAAQQAASNVAASPWADRIEVICADFAQFTTDEPFDLIVSNPPYFVNSLQNPDAQRATARHTDSLSYDVLCKRVAELLAPSGRFTLIYPVEFLKDVMAASACHHLSVECVTHVFTKPQQVKRMIASFLHEPKEGLLPTHEVDKICIQDERGNYTEEYRLLTAPFYLHF